MRDAGQVVEHPTGAGIQRGIHKWKVETLPSGWRNRETTLAVTKAMSNSETLMAFVTADVVASPGEETPYKVVFKKGETVLIEWGVSSQQEGEQQIVECIESITDDEDDDD
jgi:hypothetical protein